MNIINSDFKQKSPKETSETKGGPNTLHLNEDKEVDEEEVVHFITTGITFTF